MLGDPFVLNHRNFPSATMLSDATTVLGALVGGNGTTTIGCLGGAQIDRAGNINSTHIVPRPFLVGSGGGNDVASVAAENVVVATLTPQRTVEACSYITSPGLHVQALVTDLATFERVDDELVLTALVPGASVEQVRELVGWELRVADEVTRLNAPTTDEVAALRAWDPDGWFLRG
jgi:acyl CoA:acetate/3-ketoacid CoA transferase beta subunit